jgi:hypothetical protein
MIVFFVSCHIGSSRYFDLSEEIFLGYELRWSLIYSAFSGGCGSFQEVDPVLSDIKVSNF